MTRLAGTILLCALPLACSDAGDDLELYFKIHREVQELWFEELEELDEEEREGAANELHEDAFRDVMRDHDEEVSRLIQLEIAGLPELDLKDIERASVEDTEIELADDERSSDFYLRVYVRSAVQHAVSRVQEELDLGGRWDFDWGPTLCFRLSDEENVFVAKTLAAYVLIPYEFDRRGFLRTEDRVTVHLTVER